MKESLKLLDLLIFVESKQDELNKASNPLLNGESSRLFHLKVLRELIIKEFNEKNIQFNKNADVPKYDILTEGYDLSKLK